METLWPWLAVVGLGVLHGASPANGWMFAAACGVRSRDDTQVRRALLPIAVGHAASIAIVVGAVAQGILMDRRHVQLLAGALLLVVATYRALGGTLRHVAGARTPARAGDAGIALWSCLMATVHGTGLMLVPALAPLCMSDTPARAITASGSLLLVLVAVGVHLGAMLITTGAIASGVCRGVALLPRRMSGGVLRRAWTVALAVTGLALAIVR